MEREPLFFSLNKESDFRRGSRDNLEWAGGGLRIQQTQKYGIRRTLRISELDGIREARDFAIGPYGRMYVLDDAGDVWMYDQDSRYHEKLFPSGHGLFGRRSMLAVIDDTLLVADPEQSDSCSAYSVGNSQTYWSFAESGGLRVYPLAVVAGDQHFYVVTPLSVEQGEDGELRVPAGGGIGIVKINRSGQHQALYSDEKWTLKTEAPLRQLDKRFFAAVASGRGLYVFDSEAHILHGFSLEGEPIPRIFLPSLRFAGLAVDSKHQLYIGDSRHIADEGEDDRFILNLGETGEWINKVPGFRGKADKLLFDTRDRMFILNSRESTITILELQPRTLEREDTGMLEGILITMALDSTEAETVWHKMTLDARIPDETQLKISYFCSDRDSLIVDGSYTAIDEFIGDSRMSTQEKARKLDPYWSAPIINPKDALFFEA